MSSVEHAQHQPQREGGRGLGGQRRVRAEQHQPQPFVERDVRRGRPCAVCASCWAAASTSSTGSLRAATASGAQPVEDPAPGGGQQPGRWVRRRALRRPGPGRRLEGVGEAVLGEVEAPELRDQQGQQPTPLVAPDLLERLSRHRRRSVVALDGDDGADLGGVAGRQQPAELHRRVEVGHVDEVEAADLLGGLGERAVGDGPPPSTVRTVVAVSAPASASPASIVPRRRTSRSNVAWAAKTVSRSASEARSQAEGSSSVRSRRYLTPRFPSGRRSRGPRSRPRRRRARRPPGAGPRGRRSPRCRSP